MRWAVLLVITVGCKAEPPADTGIGLLGDGWHNPFPSSHGVVDGRLSLGSLGLPTNDEGDPLPIERLAWRSGFSVAQTAVVQLAGVDATSFPSWRSPEPGEGSVLLVDLDDGVFLPVMAELDAHPDVVGDPSILIRPVQALPLDHRVAVVVTTAAAPRPPRFDALLGEEPPSTLADVAPHYVALIDELVAVGIAADDVAFAWDFPIGDGTTPMRSAVSQVAPSADWTFDLIRDADVGDRVAPMTWRAGEGTYVVQDFLLGDEILDLQADGTVLPTGSTDAVLYVHIPASVADAPAGTVPVLLFGHGIFSSPEDYLDQEDDPSGVLQLAEEGGFIVVGTEWRALSASDLLGAVSVANDFTKIPLLGDRFVQGQVNTHTLAWLVRDGGLLDDPIFSGRSGQSLPERGRLLYYGISLGGIEGGVFVATGAPVDAAVLHVGGSMWSTMLERSSNWPTFETILTVKYPNPAERQLLYAVSQLYWDPADPIAYADDLRATSFLLQESIGDEQVPNMTTRALARSAGLDVLAPVLDLPWGLSEVVGPLGPGSSALVQFDPQLAIPPDTNRPALVSGAHGAPRHWAGARRQVLDHLESGVEGQVVHHCGALPCSADNQGD
jgi:hypothetical protein